MSGWKLMDHQKRSCIWAAQCWREHSRLALITRREPPASMRLQEPDPDYRLNVGICVCHKGLVWVGKRCFKDRPIGTWQTPQGGIDPGEDHTAAAKRELEEETGITSVKLLAEADGWLHYTFEPGRPPKHLKEYKGQAQKWVLMQFEGQEDEVRLDKHEPEFTEWAWWPLDRVVSEVAEIKKGVYKMVGEEFGMQILEQGRSSS
ncbi:hypothetical protein WJX73_002362 [Symbiochloris irregularis]|uniref:Nudix hydrolase domain-containing protein n=1 Tax=Symbiochloris irregularis TaxID=706552 RepID=A0AAW1PSK7_9CHLO